MSYGVDVISAGGVDVTTPRKVVWERVHIDDGRWTEFDNLGSNAAGAMSGDVLTFTTGTNAGDSSAPYNALAWTRPAFDLQGTRLAASTSAILAVYLQITESSISSLVLDGYIGIGLCNNADPANAACDGIGIRIAYSSSNRIVAVCSWTNGAGFAAAPESSPDATSIGALGEIVSANNSRCRVTGIESGPALSSTQAQTAGNDFTAANLWWIVWGGKTSANATSMTMATTLSFVAHPAPALGLLA